jgi:hypothetical protein
MFWDTGGLIDRTTGQVRDPELYGIMKQTLNGRATTAETDLLFIRSGEEIKDTKIHLNLNGNTFVSLSEGATTLRREIDYTLEGSVLTIYNEKIATWAAGPFGQKAMLAVNVSSGPAWKVYVRYIGAAELSPVAGTTGGNVVIPTAFNGDLLATMEARRADGSPAGPADWTPFKQWGVYLPNYTSDTITIDDEFFAGEPAGTIDLKFHFWSGRVATYQFTLQPGGSSGGEDLTIYDNNLAAGWQSWSWATVNFANTAAAYSAPNSISVDAGVWASLYLAYQGEPLNTSAYNTLTFWANGGPSGGQRVTISAAVNFNGDGLPSHTIDLPANTWRKFEVPLEALGVQGQSNITNFGFMNTSGQPAPTFYIDEIKLTPAHASTLLQVTGVQISSGPAIPPLKIRGLMVEQGEGSGPLQRKVVVRNIGSQPVVGPIYLVLDGLSLNTALVNAGGLTTNIVSAGNPYVLVMTGNLQPGQKIRTLLDFSVPQPAGEVTFTPKVLTDGMVP